jgi:hypothetical protein
VSHRIKAQLTGKDMIKFICAPFGVTLTEVHTLRMPMILATKYMHRIYAFVLLCKQFLQSWKNISQILRLGAAGLSHVRAAAAAATY